MPRQRGTNPFACNCAIALRVNSTGFCKALEVLLRVRPRLARKILRETNEHAARLRKACPHEHSGAIL